MPPSTKAKIPGFFIVIFSAVSGFTLSFLLLNFNYADYKKLPEQARFCLQDTCITMNVKQTYHLKDTIAYAKEIIPINKRGKILFHYNPSFLMWTMFILLMMTVATGALPVFIDYIKNLKKKFLISRKDFLLIILFTTITAAIMTLMPLKLRGYYTPFEIIGDFGILFKHNIVILILSISSILLSLPMIITMFLVGAAVNRIKIDQNETETRKKIELFTYLNSVLLASLQVLAVIVVLSGFCSAALGESLKSTFTISGLDIFPKEMSYAYGLFYAMFLAIFYLPVYFNLKEKGKVLKEQILVSAGTLDEKGAEKQKELGENLDLKTSALDSLKLALTILSPLIASFIPEHLQFFK